MSAMFTRLRTNSREFLRSSLVVAQRGRYFAELTGEVHFPTGYRLNVYERLSWEIGPITIEGYSYEVWCGSEQLYWYDSQPHPNDPASPITPHCYVQQILQAIE